METKKMKWGNPLVEVQQFTPQEFVAVCLSKDDTCKDGCVYGWAFKMTQTNGTPTIQYTTNPNGGATDDSWVMLAPEGQTSGFTLSELFDGTTPQFSGYVLVDINNDSKLSAGDYITWSGANFYINSSSSSATGYAHPSVTTYTASGHS